MITTSKAYPNFIFTNEHNRTITYSINGDSPMVGWSGKEVTRFPTGLNSTIVGYCFGMIYNNKKYSARWYGREKIANGLKYLALLDKIASVDASILNKEFENGGYEETSLGCLYNVFQTHGFKNAIKAYQAIQGNFQYLGYDLIDAIVNELVKDKYTKYNLVNLTDATEIMRYERDAKEMNISFEKYIHLLDRMIGSDLAKLIGRREIDSLVKDYARYCSKLGWKLETGDFIKNAAKAKATYEAMKDEIDDKFFKSNQMARPLLFENEEYSIVVPQGRADCIAEGTALRNCLGTFEWNNYLSTGRRVVVFIRKKDNIDKPYVACDIDIDTGEIMQYLTYNNRRPSGDSAEKFRNLYQEYLNNIWAEG